MSSNAGVNQERICSPPSAPVTKSPSQPQSPPPKAQPKTQPHAGNVDTEAPKNQEKSSLQREKQDRVKHEKRERRKAEKQEKEKQEKEKQEKEKQEKEKQEKEKQEKEKQEKEKPTSQERQQRRQQEFSSGTSKARGEARNLQTSKSAEQDRPHQRSGEKSGPVPTPGTVSGGKKEKQRPEQSLFVEHIITNYPLLTVTCNEVNNRLPIKIPNPNDLPLFSRLPSIASFPVLSTIDQTLNGILNRIDSAFPVLKSDPEHLVHQVAEITDPWIAPANTWLVDHLPTSKESARKDSSRRRQRRKEQGKKWSEQKAPGEKSFADTVAENNGGSSSSSEDNAEAKGQKPSEQEKDQKKDQQQQIDMELLKTVAIFQGALQAQLDRADNARGYIAEVILPGYVPLVGGWLGDKVAGREKKRVRGGKKSGKKTGEEERKERRLGEQAQGEEGDRERGEKVLREGKRRREL